MCPHGAGQIPCHQQTPKKYRCGKPHRATAKHSCDTPSNSAALNPHKATGSPHSRLLSEENYTVGMTLRVVLEYDAESGDYSAVCPELPGCASAVETEEEAKANIREAIELYLSPREIDVPENARVVEVTVG